MPLAYAFILLAAFAALVLGYLILPLVGAVGVVAVAVALGLLPLFRRNQVRFACAGLAVSTCVCSAVFPALDAQVVAIVQPSGPLTARTFLDEGGTLLAARWDRVAYTQLIAFEGEIVGAYDNLQYWTTPDSDDAPPPSGPLSTFIFEVIPEGSRVAVLGVGGGRQLLGAVSVDRRLALDAFEINRSVVTVLRDEHPEWGRGILAHPSVRAFGRDGRAGVVSQAEPYDHIFLAEAGSVLQYYKVLTGDLNFLHTRDAYADYIEQLRPGGTIAVAFHRWADPDYYATERIGFIMRDLGLEPLLLTDDDFHVLLGGDPVEARPTLDHGRRMALGYGLTEVPVPETVDLSRGPVPTDDAGLNLLPVYLGMSSATRMRTFLWSLAIALLSALVTVLVLSRRTGGQAQSSRGFLASLALAVALGVSFLVLQNALVLQLARQMWNMADAAIIGSTLFLAAAGAGALAGDMAHRYRGVAALLLLVAAVATGVRKYECFRPDRDASLDGSRHRVRRPVSSSVGTRGLGGDLGRLCFR